MIWGTVDPARHGRPKAVVVIGQGPSFKTVCLGELRKAQRAGALLIAVNGAVKYVPFADVFFSLDHSDGQSIRRAMKAGTRGMTSYLAFPDHNTTSLHVPGLINLKRLSNPDDGVSDFSVRVRQQMIGGLAEDPGEIHSGNSGFGALGVAYHLRPETIVLLGIDGRGRLRHDLTPNRYLGHLPELFEGARPQLLDAGIRVINGSPHSAVSCFPRWSAKAALKELELHLKEAP